MKVQVYLCGKCHAYESDEENFRIFIDGKEVIHDTSVFEWCHDCKEYDQENYCCHRWSKVIRKTIDECKQELEEEYIPIDWLENNGEKEIVEKWRHSK